MVSCILLKYYPLKMMEFRLYQSGPWSLSKTFGNIEAVFQD
jgi:hypothetical protein